jgi:hypothetical protein
VPPPTIEEIEEYANKNRLQKAFEFNKHYTKVGWRNGNGDSIIFSWRNVLNTPRWQSNNYSKDLKAINNKSIGNNVGKLINNGFKSGYIPPTTD